MDISLKTKTCFTIVALLIGGLVSACASPAIPQTSSLDEPVTPSDNSSISLTQDNASDLSNRVDVVYFHRPQRCASCLCFEERVRYVVGTYFQNEINTGKMTFGVYDIGDSQNKDLVNKYGAVGSQLFINVVTNGTDNIKDIQDIWSWNCRTDKPGFDQKVKNVIDQSLRGEE